MHGASAPIVAGFRKTLRKSLLWSRRKRVLGHESRDEPQYGSSARALGSGPGGRSGAHLHDHGQCGIPADALSFSVNVTITGPTALGNLTFYPAGTPAPLVSTINYRPGQTRANNAVLPLGVNGDFSVLCIQASGAVHFILDVNGYYQ